MAVAASGPQGDGRPRKRSDIDAERRARYEATSREIDRLVAEAHARLPRHLAKVVGAIYVRFSTWMQDSAEDQVRTILKFAVENGIYVAREHVYFDLGVRGHKSKRDGLDQLRKALRAKMVKVLLLFATNRLFRKVYRTLEFAEEVVNEYAIRAVFVKSGVDSANKDQWKMLLHFRAIMDEFQVSVSAEHIRAALEGLFLEGYVYGTLTFGYRGEPVPGKLTKRKRPRCRIVPDPEEKKVVVWIFEWWARDRLSLIEIAQKLNAIAGVPQPRKSNGQGWKRSTVRAVLKREAYRGIWKFSVTEKTFLPTKDYARQIPRDKPLNEATFENLRLVSDALWFAAQTRLAKNKGIRGRNSKTHHADSAPRVLSGLFWCPQHDRPLLACSANGNYLGCPTCATIEPHSRPLFSKPHRRVVLRLLCQKLAALISQDDKLVERIVAACQTSAAAAQRPDAAELTSLEKSVADLTRKIEFNIRNPGDTAEDEKEIALVLQSLRQERKQFQAQLSLLKALAAEPVRVPAVDEVRSVVSRFGAILEQGARSELADDHAIVRDVLETLTGGRIDMYQQGQRKNMQGWLQARFSVRLLDLLVERATGTRLQTGVDYIDVVIDFKRPRKCDSDADAAIASWLGGAFNREIAEQIGSGPSYVTRMLNLGAQRRGTTLEALRPLRKARPADPAHAPAYQNVADEVKALWWDNLIPLGTVAKRVKVSTVTANAAKDWWYESRGLKTPNYNEWSLEVERRVLELFDAEELTIGQIGEKVRRAHGTVMQIVHAACERLGRPLPDAWSRRSRLKSEKGNASEPAA